MGLEAPSPIGVESRTKSNLLGADYDTDWARRSGARCTRCSRGNFDATGHVVSGFTNTRRIGPARES